MNMLNRGRQFKNKKFLFLIIIISAAVNLAFLEYNNQLIRKDNPGNVTLNAASLVYNQTVFSVDNEYYLSPVDNFLTGKGWKRSPGLSNGDYFRRVPGYSAIYLVFVDGFGYRTGHLLLKIFQLCLFLSTIPAIFYLAKLISGNSASRIITAVYAMIPFISSWTYYTLTESVTPALVIFYVYFLLKAYNSGKESAKLKNYLAASLFFVFGVLTRPYIAIAGIALLYCTFKDYIILRPQAWFRRISFIWIIPFLFIGCWTLRNYLLTSEFVPLEKPVHPQTLDRMKPEFRGLWRFAKCWGEDGINLNSYHDPLYSAALRGDTSGTHVKEFLTHLPPNIVAEFGEGRLYGLVKRYQLNVFGFKPYVDSIKAMPSEYLPEQLAIEKAFDQLVSDYKKKHFLNYWVKTPLIYLKRIVVNSNTANLSFFNGSNRKNSYVNIYRYILVMIHIFLYACLLINLFFIRNFANRLVFVFVPMLFIVFFTVIHREIEQRYMLPVLPLIIIGAAASIDRMINLIDRKSVNKNVHDKKESVVSLSH